MIGRCLPTAAHAATPTSIMIGGTDSGPTFRIRAASGGGGNSRLLIGCSEPQCSQLLDHLFKPSYGASRQVLKSVQYVTVQPESGRCITGDTIDVTGQNRSLKDTTTSASDPQGRSVVGTTDHVVEAGGNSQSFVDLSGATVSCGSSDATVATPRHRG